MAVVTAAGGWIGYFLGGADGLLIALTVFIVMDYLTGIMCAIADRKLSSAVGFKASDSLLSRKTSQYPSSYTSSHQIRYKKDIAASNIVADCIGGVIEAIGTDKAFTSK